MNKILVTSIVAAASLAVCGFAFSAGYKAPSRRINTWYAGAGFNYNAALSNHYTATGYDFNNAGVRGYNYTLDHKGLGINLLAGKRINRTLAFEGGLSYIGRQTYKDGTTAKIDQKNTYNAYFDGLLIKQLPYDLEAFIKGGANFYRQALTLNEFASSSGVATSDSTTQFAFNAGVGLQWNYQQIGVRAAYSHVMSTRNAEFFHAVPDTINFDFLWHFA